MKNIKSTEATRFPSTVLDFDSPQCPSKPSTTLQVTQLIHSAHWKPFPPLANGERAHSVPEMCASELLLEARTTAAYHLRWRLRGSLAPICNLAKSFPPRGPRPQQFRIVAYRIASTIRQAFPTASPAAVGCSPSACVPLLPPSSTRRESAEGPPSSASDLCFSSFTNTQCACSANPHWVFPQAGVSTHTCTQAILQISFPFYAACLANISIPASMLIYVWWFGNGFSLIFYSPAESSRHLPAANS